MAGEEALIEKARKDGVNPIWETGNKISGHNVSDMNVGSNIRSGSKVPFDDSWVASAFMTSGEDVDDEMDEAFRYASSADFKFTDSSLGGNIGVNTRPQWTRYADIRRPGLIRERHDVTVLSGTPKASVGGEMRHNAGMGRYYSEVIDDPSRAVYLRFGVPEFSSMGAFLTSFSDYNLTNLVTGGGTKSWLYNVGEVLGTIGMAIAAPAITGSVLLFKYFTRNLTGNTSKYYSLKSTMTIYWATVNVLVNTIAINRGLFNKTWQDPDAPPEGVTGRAHLTKGYKIEDSILQGLHEMMPHIFDPKRGISVLMIANRAQMIQNRYYDRIDKKMSSDNAEAYSAAIAESFKGMTLSEILAPKTDKGAADTQDQSLARLLKVTGTTDYYLEADGKDNKLPGKPIQQHRLPPGKRDGASENEKSWEEKETDEGWIKSFLDFSKAEYQQGGEFAVFRVDSTETMVESFSNSVKDSDLGNKFNSASSNMRDIRFNFSGGNLGDGMLSNAIEAAGKGVKDIATGFLDGITFGLSEGIMNMLAGINVEVPKYWDSASFTLPAATYKLQLISPSNNAFTRIKHFDLPISMLLAGMLPRKTGPQSHGSPFYCQVFDRGRLQQPLSMITELTITRGTSNLGFDLRGNALAIDVSFTVTDLSPIMSAAIAGGDVLNHDEYGSSGMLDEDSIIYDYMAVLGAQGINEQILITPRAKMRQTARDILGFATLVTDPASLAAYTHDSMTSGAMGKLMLGVPSIFEAFSRSTAIKR